MILILDSFYEQNVELEKLKEAEAEIARLTAALEQAAV